MWSRIVSTVILIVGTVQYVSSFAPFANIKLPSISLEKLSGAQDKFNGKRICVITGTSSGLGKSTTKWLLETGNWHIICACRDIDKMNVVAEVEGFDPKSFTVMPLDLQSFQSVRDFAANLIEFKAGKPIDRLVCNAAIYQPSLQEAKYTEDGIEQQLQVNHLSHFLLSSLLIPEMKEAEDPRLIMVGSVTGNDNTVGGGGVYPIADLKDLDGLRQGGKAPIAMIDGFNFNGAKAYKDTKMCLMMTSNTLHDRFHRSTGVAFSSIYPGCIAESPLFREKRPWFRKFFPVFMKYVTGGFVGETEAGQRLGQVVADPRCSKSGVYWSWNGGPRQGRGVDALKNGGNIIGAGGAGGDWESIYENDQSDRVRDPETMALLWQYSNEITGAVWPLSKQPISPCPTLKFISFVTSIVEGKEALERRQKQGEAAPKTMKEMMEKLAV